MATNISTITINASLKRVWDTITNPDLVKLWQYGSKLQTTWQVNCPIKFSTKWEGKLYEQWGIIKEVIPYSLVKYSLFAPRPDLEDKPESLFMMSYDLTTIDDATKLDFIQDDYRPSAVKGNAAGLGLNEAKLWSDLKRRSPTVKLKSTLIIV